MDNTINKKEAFWRNACNPSKTNEEREADAKAILASIKIDWNKRGSDYMRAKAARRLVLRSGRK